MPSLCLIFNEPRSFIDFNDAQCEATKDAETIAGFQALRIVNKPTAAAIAYGFNRKGDESQFVVYDLGGGTFDVPLLSNDDGYLEGLAEKISTTTSSTTSLSPTRRKPVPTFLKNLHALGKLKHGVEKARWTLSSHQSAGIKVESFEDGNDFSEALTTAKLEELNMDLFRKTIKLIE